VCNSSEREIFIDSAKKKLSRAATAQKILNKVLREKKIQLDSYTNLRLLEFHVMKDLLKEDLYLYPKYLNYPNVGAIITNFDCNFRCSHCYQPDYKKGNVKMEHVNLFLDKLLEVNIRRIGIYGGECFLYPKLLKEIVKSCSKRNIRSTITTNGFWCKNDLEKNLKMLRSVDFNGTILISIGIGHLEFLKDISFFENIDVASKEIFGENIFHFSFEDLSKKEFQKNRKKISFLEKKYNVRFRRIYPMGQGKVYQKKIIDEHTDNFIYSNRLQCNSPTLLPDGSVSFCLGPKMRDKPFNKNKITKELSFEKIFLEEDKRYTVWSRFRGYEITDYLEKKGLINKKEDYPHICMLCSKTVKKPELINTIYEDLVKEKEDINKLSILK